MNNKYDNNYNFDEFLLDFFNVNKKLFLNKDNEYFIPIDILYSLNLTKDENEYAINFAHNHGIYIGKIDLNNENFNDYVTSLDNDIRDSIPSNRIDYRERMKMFYNYINETDKAKKEKLFNEIFYSNLYMTDVAIKKSLKNYKNIDYDDLCSYVYEAYVRAIKTYKPGKCNFLLWVLLIVDRNVKRELMRSCGLGVNNNNLKLLTTLNEYELNNNVILIENSRLVNDFLLYYSKKTGIDFKTNPKEKLLVKNKLNILFAIRYDELSSDFSDIYNDDCNNHDELFYKATKSMQKDILENALKILTPEQESIVRLRYGIDDGIFKTYEQLGNFFNVNWQEICKIDRKAIRKLTKSKDENVKSL